jgi:hypothetical protein
VDNCLSQLFQCHEKHTPQIHQKQFLLIRRFGVFGCPSSNKLCNLPYFYRWRNQLDLSCETSYQEQTRTPSCPLETEPSAGGGAHLTFIHIHYILLFEDRYCPFIVLTFLLVPLLIDPCLFFNMIFIFLSALYTQPMLTLNSFAISFR